ncbi:MAG: hypothetical protein ABIJ18_05870 [archaeon]
MKELIKTLKKQYDEILTIFEALEDFCRGKAQKDWVAEKGNIIYYLKKFKKSIQEHVKLETDQLYPSLLNSKDKALKKKGEKYFDEMNRISENMVQFFDKYNDLKQGELSSNIDFKLDLTTIIKNFKKRIDVEEIKLFPLYEQLK